jgi:hypothetical protein
MNIPVIDAGYDHRNMRRTEASETLESIRCRAKTRGDKEPTLPPVHARNCKANAVGGRSEGTLKRGHYDTRNSLRDFRAISRRGFGFSSRWAFMTVDVGPANGGWPANIW